jgi:multiple sugar transport system ATP-binding protein
VDVRLVEPLGSEQLVHFTLDAPQIREGTAEGDDQVAEGEILAAPVANGVAVTPPRAPVSAGSRTVLRVDPEQLHFFDPDTGVAVPAGH